MTPEQSILSKIVTLFATEKIIWQHNVLGYKIDAYFTKYKLQPFTEYLSQTLVFMRNSALREKFNFFFSAFFC